MAFKNEHDAGYLSEPIFGRFWDDFGLQNRPKIGPESVSRRKKQIIRSGGTPYVYL